MNGILNHEKVLKTMERATNVILAAAGCLCIAGLLYFVYYYSWTGQRDFSSWAGIVVYYFVPALGATAMFASLRLRPSYKINLALSLVSMTAAVYVVEVGASVWFKLPSVTEREFRKTIAQAAQAVGARFDSRSTRDVVRDLRKQGIDAAPSVYPLGLLERKDENTVHSVIDLNGAEVLPLASISNRVTVVCNETGEFLTYKSDEHGFNNPQQIWDKPVQIVALGDSFTEGFCVPREQSFVGQIRRRYPATVNLGIAGNGPLLMLASLREYAEIFKPAVVLWFYFEGNDLADLLTEKDSPLLRGYLTSGFRLQLIQRQPEIDRVLADFVEASLRRSEFSRKFDELAALARRYELRLNALESVIKLSQLRTRLGLIQGKSARDTNHRSDDESRTGQMRETYSLFQNILFEAKRSTAEWGGRLYFVYLPSWDRYAGDGGNPDRNPVLRTVEDLKIPLIDIHQVFSAHQDPLALFPFRVAHHYTEEGHGLVAEEVIRALSMYFR